MYTYKDPDLPLVWRLGRAWENLKTGENFSNTDTDNDPLTTNPETLGIAGAIYKRKWEVDGQRKHLERSLRLYLRGYAQGAPPEDRKYILSYLGKTKNARLDADKNERGYPGINAAFILDLLAELEEKEAENADLHSEHADRMRLDANLIRDEITRSVPL